MKFLNKEGRHKEDVLHLVNKHLIYFKDCGKSVELYILKAHLITELLLNLFIERQYKNPSGIIDCLSFWQKVKLIEGFALIEEDTITGLKIINKIRNGYAHNLDFEVSSDLIQDLEKQIPEFSATESPFYLRVHIVLMVYIIDVAYSLELDMSAR